jgi:hypothetical protein
MFRVHMWIVWIHKALFYKAYGWRGPLNFLLKTLFIASSTTRYVDGPVRFLLRNIEVKWQLRQGYRDPVLCQTQSLPANTSGLPLPQAKEN